MVEKYAASSSKATELARTIAFVGGQSMGKWPSYNF